MLKTTIIILLGATTCLTTCGMTALSTGYPTVELTRTARQDQAGAAVLENINQTGCVRVFRTESK